MKGDIIPLNPINFVLNTQQLQKYECVICFRKSINILSCKTCGKYFCYQCATDQKQSSNRCPFRCTQGSFQLQQIKEIKIQYKCPFSSQCHEILKNKKQFWQHDRFCQFISKQQKLEQFKKWRFLCQKEHQLQIDFSPYSIISKRKLCSGCQCQAITRVFCKKCQTQYCNFCRPLPLIQNKCPRNHKYQIIYSQNTMMFCDCCQLLMSIINKKVYNDFFCNFDICQDCFSNYPRCFQSIYYVENDRNYCDVGMNLNKLSMLKSNKQQHLLTIVKERVFKICDWCQKQKYCYKKCNKCDKYYCTPCKLLKIFFNFECEFGHQVLITNQQQQFKQSLSNCSMCEKKLLPEEGYAIDIVCQIILCLKCLQQQIQRDEDERKQYACMRKCDRGHHVALTHGIIIQQCYICKNKWLIKLYCPNCSRFYCTKCVKPINKYSCYCQKLLKKKLFKKKLINCIICGLEVFDRYQCSQCSYAICYQCYNQTIVVEYDVQ